MTALPPCAGKWVLFDSTDMHDHHLAREMCAVCPMLVACRQRLTMARAAARTTGVGGGPQGTWAGMLIGNPRDEARMEREAARYTPEELIRAHAAYNRGERDAWTNLGERVYQRGRERADRRRGAA